PGEAVGDGAGTAVPPQQPGAVFGRRVPGAGGDGQPGGTPVWLWSPAGGKVGLCGGAATADAADTTSGGGALRQGGMAGHRTGAARGGSGPEMAKCVHG